MKILIFQKETTFPTFPWVCPTIFVLYWKQEWNKIYQQHIIHLYTVYVMLQVNSSNLPILKVGQLETKVNQGRTDFNYTSPEACGTQESGNLAKSFCLSCSLNPEKDLVWMVKKHSMFMYFVDFCRIVSTTISVPPIWSSCNMYHQGLSRKPCVPWNWKVSENSAANQEHVGKERKLDTDQRWIHLQTTLHLDFVNFQLSKERWVWMVNLVNPSLNFGGKSRAELLNVKKHC